MVEYLRSERWHDNIEQMARERWGNMIVNECLSQRETIFGTYDFSDRECLVVIHTCGPELLVFPQYQTVCHEALNLVNRLRTEYHVPETTISWWYIFVHKYTKVNSNIMSFCDYSIDTGEPRKRIFYRINLNQEPRVKKLNDIASYHGWDVCDFTDVENDKLYHYFIM